MADDVGRGTDPEQRRTDDTHPGAAGLEARLRGLGDDLERHRPRAAPQDQRSRPGANTSGIARGFALSSQLVAGVLVGAAVGMAFDYLFAIKPWGLIVFVLLGFTAGVMNVVRMAGGGRPPPGTDP